MDRIGIGNAPGQKDTAKLEAVYRIARMGIAGTVFVASLQIGGVAMALIEAFIALVIILAKEC